MSLELLFSSRPAVSRAALKPATLAIVFFAGVNLILVQWVMVRELTSLLLGTELVTLLVSLSYFAGLSVGYALARPIQKRRAWLTPLAVLTLALHLTLPVWFRGLVVALDAAQAYALAYLVLPLLSPFVVSSFYSIFLPLFADSEGENKGNLSQLYGMELLGAATGVIGLVLLGGLGVQAVYILYTAGLLLILAALRLQPRWLAALAIVSGAWLAALPVVNATSNAAWYIGLHDLPDGTRTLFTGYSPYQKVDVLEAPDGSRFLYLDGLQHFGTRDGSRLNVVMGKIPADLLRPQKALVFGAGSMEMAQMMAQYAGHVQTVEIDPLVIESSLRYFDAVNQMSNLTNRSIAIDDAKHYIANTPEMYHLISTDLPAAYSLQTATLYSEPFFRAVAEKLHPDGVFVVNLTSEFGADDLVSRRIAAGLLATFEEVMVVTPATVGWSFAYASNALPFDRAALSQKLHYSGEREYVIYETEAVRALVGDARPVNLDSMDIVLHVSADWIGDRIRGN